MDLVDKTLEPCKQALKDAGRSTAQINEVILVGGQTGNKPGGDTVEGEFREV